MLPATETLAEDGELRARTLDDASVDAVIDAMLVLNASEHIAWSREDGEAPLRELAARRELGVVSVLERAGSFVGYFVLTWGFDLEWGGRDAFLTELYLSPASRGQGLGKRALGLVERTASAHGARAVHLMVRHDNTVAEALYRGAGFVEPPRKLLTKALRGPTT
jgi:ribosomal protein S18 acetylase RimI-like enzyme